MKSWYLYNETSQQPCDLEKDWQGRRGIENEKHNIIICKALKIETRDSASDSPPAPGTKIHTRSTTMSPTKLPKAKTITPSIPSGWTSIARRQVTLQPLRIIDWNCWSEIQAIPKTIRLWIYRSLRARTHRAVRT